MNIFEQRHKNKGNPRRKTANGAFAERERGEREQRKPISLAKIEKYGEP